MLELVEAVVRSEALGFVSAVMGPAALFFAPTGKIRQLIREIEGSTLAGSDPVDACQASDEPGDLAASDARIA